MNTDTIEGLVIAGVIGFLLWRAAQRRLTKQTGRIENIASSPEQRHTAGTPDSPSMQVTLSSGVSPKGGRRTMSQESKDRTQHACLSVLKSVIAPQEAKQALLDEFITAHENGSPRDEEEAVVRHFEGTGWTWSEFDRWELEFKKRGQWPYMWDSLCLDEEAPDEPTSVADAIDRLTVAEMRDWLRTYAPELKPMPKKWVELEQACRTHLAWEQVREAALARHQDLLERFRETRDLAKCRLLAHTLTMTCYSHRNYIDEKKSGLGRFEALSCGDEDPIEKECADRFNRGELKDQLPPFFPGDRCDLLPCLEEDADNRDR